MLDEGLSGVSVRAYRLDRLVDRDLGLEGLLGSGFCGSDLEPKDGHYNIYSLQQQRHLILFALLAKKLQLQRLKLDGKQILRLQKAGPRRCLGFRGLPRCGCRRGSDETLLFLFAYPWALSALDNY